LPRHEIDECVSTRANTRHHVVNLCLQSKFYALDQATGSIIWNYATTLPPSLSVALSNGSVAYVASNDGFIALNATTGARLWLFAEQGGRHSPTGALIAPNRNLYLFTISQNGMHYLVPINHCGNSFGRDKKWPVPVML